MSGVDYTGQLLVAKPSLRDPNFVHSVVLVLDHDENGTLGVVINRPTETPVTSVLAGWTEFVSEPDVLFQGGPVSKNSALGLAEVAVSGGSGEVVGWRRLYGRIGLVDLDTPPELLAGGVGPMRVFAGYAGWSSGQLDEEVAAGSWGVVDSEPSDAFSSDPKNLWRRVLRRQRGPLAMLATFSEDPQLN